VPFMVFYYCSSNINLSHLLMGLSWSWSYGSWIYNYLCNQCLSPQTLWVWILLSRGVLYMINLSVTCSRSVVSLVFSTNKTDCHDITEILLKVALNILTLNITLIH
jgi:hypothetical protein